MARRFTHTTTIAFAIAFGAAAVQAPAVFAAGDSPDEGRAYDGDTVIVKYRPGVAPAVRARVLERAGAVEALAPIGSVGAKLVRVTADPARVAERLEGSQKVAYAEPNLLMKAQRLPNDHRFGDQWALRNVGQTGGRRGADISAVRGWNRAGLGAYPGYGGARVGIIDTGIDPAHPDLAGRTVACAQSRPASVGEPVFQPGICTDDSGHGTHVAGTIAAIADNGVGVAGVAFNSPLVVCRALGGSSQTGRVSDIVNCLRWVRAQGARAISMSFAGGRSKTLRRAIKKAWKGGGRSGSILVSAAGNDGRRMAAYPAAYKQVISVAATNDKDRHAAFSNVHSTVEVSAPGVGILSTRDGGGYRRLSGTSMAVPHVVGVAAHLRRLFPNAEASRLRTKIRRRSDDLGPRGKDPRFGHGRVNLARAVRR